MKLLKCNKCKRIYSATTNNRFNVKRKCDLCGRIYNHKIIRESFDESIKGEVIGTKNGRKHCLTIELDRKQEKLLGWQGKKVFIKR